MNNEKVQKAIDRLKAFEPADEPYYLCYSGGKDSDCIRILADLAGVKHDKKKAEKAELRSQEFGGRRVAIVITIKVLLRLLESQKQQSLLQKNYKRNMSERQKTV